MTAYSLPNGNLMVPKRAIHEGFVGDGYIEVGPGDPDYEGWMDQFRRKGTEPEPWPQQEADK